MRYLALLLVVAACSNPSDDPMPDDFTPDPISPEPVEPEPVEPAPVEPEPEPPPPAPTTLLVDVRENGLPHASASAALVAPDGKIGEVSAVGDTGKLSLPAPPEGGGVLVTAATQHVTRAQTIYLHDVFYFVGPPAGTTLLCPTGTKRIPDVALALPEGGKGYHASFGSAQNQFAGEPGQALEVDLDGSVLPDDTKSPLLLLGTDGDTVLAYGLTPEVPFEAGMKLETPAMTKDGVAKVGGKLVSVPLGKLSVSTEVWGAGGLLSIVPGKGGVEWSGKVVDTAELDGGVRASVAGEEFKILWDGDSFAGGVPVSGLARSAPGIDAALDLDLAPLLPYVSGFEIVSGQTLGAKWAFEKAPEGTDGGVLRLRWEIVDEEVTQVVRWTIVVPPGTTSVELPALPKVLAAFSPPESRSLTVSLTFVDAAGLTTWAGFLDGWSRPRATPSEVLRWTSL